MSEAGHGGELGMVRSAMRGDPEAVRALWQRHRGWVAAVVLAHKPRGADLEDLLQDVAMAYVSRIRTLREPEAFCAWLRMTALNAARAEGRERTRRRRLEHRRLREQPPSAAGGLGADAPVVWREGQSQVEGVLAELPVEYREPLILRCVRGMSYRQIAEAMDLPETTVETRIARGRRKLREALAARAADAPAGDGKDQPAQPEKGDQP